jgi:hypothetical protein
MTNKSFISILQQSQWWLPLAVKYSSHLLGAFLFLFEPTPGSADVDATLGALKPLASLTADLVFFAGDDALDLVFLAGAEDWYLVQSP